MKFSNAMDEWYPNINTKRAIHIIGKDCTFAEGYEEHEVHIIHLIDENTQQVERWCCKTLVEVRRISNQIKHEVKT